ncbi:MAG: YCF48-related protein, partial [Candidatus Electryonea clarkiae]|nr:YCF48-related protein [Candidatus Electryonea clarkiae]
GNCGVMVETNNGGSDWSVNHISNLDSIEVIKFLDDSLGFLLGYSGYSDSATCLFKTIDGGDNWSCISKFPTNTRSFHFVGEDVGWIYSDGNLLKTIDGGVNWTDVTPDDFQFTRSIYFCNDTTGWAGGIGTAIFKTNDGENWDRVAIDGLNYLAIYSIKFFNSDIGWAVGVANNGSGIILNTEDGGDSWTVQFITLSANVFYDISFVNQNICCVVSMNGRVYRTSNGGENWEPLEGRISESELRGIHLDNTSNGWTIGLHGKIFHTVDGGLNWEEQSRGFSTNLIDACFVDSMNGWVVGYVVNSPSSHSIYVTDDGGTTWASQDTPFERLPHLYAVCFVDDLNGWAGGASGVFIETSDGGETWERVEINQNIVNHISDIYFINSNIGFVLSSSQLLFTNDGGENWSLLETNSNSSLRSIFFIDDSTGWISKPSGVLRTNDGGRTWQNLDNIDGYREFEQLYFKNENEGWAVGGDETFQGNYSEGTGFIWHTDDGGETWTILDSSATHMYRSVSFSDSLNGFAAGYSGTVYSTNDGGDTWNCFNINTTRHLINIDFINSQTGWLIGSEGTILRTDIGGISSLPTLSIKNPTSYYLLNCYPNPFNNNTNIVLNIGKDCFYTLSIYNILGQNILVVYSGFSPAGKYVFSWEGLDSNGNIVPSGTYFIQFNNNIAKEIRKVLLLR